MKKIISKENRESASWNYKGYELVKLNGYWYAQKDGSLYVTNCEPSDTRQELQDGIDFNDLQLW